MKKQMKFLLIMMFISILAGLTSCQKYRESTAYNTYQDTLHQKDTSNMCTINNKEKSDYIYYVDTKETTINNYDNSSKDLNFVLIILNCVTIFISLVLVLILVFKIKT